MLYTKAFVHKEYKPKEHTIYKENQCTIWDRAIVKDCMLLSANQHQHVINDQSCKSTFRSQAWNQESYQKLCA